MADWTTLPNAAVGVGGLPSGTTVTALRDNPVAIAEGAAGAPRANGKMAATFLEYATSNPLTGLSAGDLTLQPALFEEYSFANLTITLTSFQSAGTCEISSLANGTMRFRATQSISSTTTNNRTNIMRLLKNGVEVQSWSVTANNSSNSATREVDVSAAIGDVFEWQGRVDTNNNFSASVSGISVRANDTYTTQPLQLKVSEVRP
jgi:hypothetical protein